MKRINFLIVILGLFTILVGGCSDEGSADLSSDDGVEVPTPTEPVPEEFTTPLYLRITKQLESVGEPNPIVDVGTCSIDPSVDALKTIKSCEFEIPEAEMYYSNLTFHIGTYSPGQCRLLRFQPYYYRRSAAKDFRPKGDGTPPVDCREINDDDPDNPPIAQTPGAECYGGAAPVMLGSSFPDFTGYYVLNAKHAAYPMPSSSQSRWYGNALVNYSVANNLSEAARDVAVVSGPTARVGDKKTWEDYFVTCQDSWGEMLYSIKVTIKETDWELSDPDGKDDFKNWE